MQELFNRYLTYDDYIELGGTLPLDVFSQLERKAQRYLDSITFNRIKCLTTIPDEVREVLTEFVNRMNTYEQQRQGGDLVTQYSNGVEQFSYKTQDEDSFKKELAQLAIDWLPIYLTNRMVKFDVERYLQRDYNDI